ncbi:MAG: LysM peptidoglycan-binding domain-containing protein [Deltaproteobacteria bacterium]|nr:LysM peptidoglycan-binding domain-containing protein [Deltaproteobacteria bacterium]
MKRVQGRWILVVLPWVALTVSSGVSAQGQPAAPENPQSPADYPAMPRRVATQGAPAVGAKAKSGGPVQGYAGGDMAIAPEQRALQGVVPEYHMVKKGDSLWGLCSYYYSDPWAWPQLWAFNKSITNPHWIYPGDRIRMLGAARKQAGARQPLIRARTRRAATGPIELRQHGFADEKEIQHAGSISGSKHAHTMLSLYHEVYITGSKKFRPKRGDRYAIYRTKRTLESEGKKIGHLVEILGTVRIKRSETKKQVALGEIVEAFNVIERGDKVGPLRRQLKRPVARPAKRNLSGHIVDFLHKRQWSAETQLVFLDRGSEHGVLLGNRFLVVRRGDPNNTLMQEGERDNERFPYEVVAEVSVLDVKKHASVGLITRSVKEIRKGDTVRLRRGY